MKKIIILLISIIFSIATYAQELKKTVIEVQGLCGMCQERIENAALEAGAKSADWDAETLLLLLTYNPQKVSLDDIQKKIASVGHDNETYRAPDEVYESLPKCCKYRSDHAESFLHPLKGQVLDAEGEPLPGSTISWEGTTTGVVTDENGFFTIDQLEEHVLVVNYVGYRKDTIDIGDGKGFLTINMSGSFELNTLEVTHKQKATRFSFSAPIKTDIIGEKELGRAACCNLSQSFETNPSVDVSSTDAVTGARQIEMLGLAGKYVKFMTDNIPDMRGLSVTEGLMNIPGTWVRNIYLSKGTGSVVNGFEGITGQMNIEIKSPSKGEKLFANAYINSAMGMEANVNARQPIGKNWNTSLLLHANTHPHFKDENKDSFADVPNGENFVLSNLWEHKQKNKWSQHFGFRVVNRNARSGQIEPNTTLNNPWKASSKSRGYQAYGKMGRVFEQREMTSVGFQLSGDLYQQDETFGKTIYKGLQKSLYFNGIFQSYIFNTKHQYKTGASFQYDNYEEDLNQQGLTKENYDREEIVPGAFFEYTFLPSDKFTLIAGIRADYHNAYKLFFTPRLHAKYQPSENTSFRINAGAGYRTANVLTEYKSIFASSRMLVIEQTGDDSPYGLKQEKAWNFGLNFSQKFQLFSKESVISIDAYHTYFDHKIVADYNQDVLAVHFYNLKGTAYSNSLQLQWDYHLSDDLELRLAYRYNDVKFTDKNDKLQREPFTPKHRAFANINYSINNGWNFNATTVWVGSKEMPDLSDNPMATERSINSPNYFLSNMQASKTWDNRWDVYAGVENIFNYKQSNPIISAENPWSPSFDATQIWGPVNGREFYIGVRYRILE